jgi:membrane protein implicated in regulation of membrane protease activity
MDIQLLYWHWLIIGMLLVVAEIFIPSFTVLWFGLGALVVGLVGMVAPMSMTTQILVWTVSSVLFVVGWFKVIKPKMAVANQNKQSRQSAIGESGLVIKLPSESTLGTMRFSTPVLDRDEWHFSCDVAVELGDRLHIQEISDQTLVVVRLN